MIFNMSIEEWDAVINVHLRGAFCVVKPACVLMRAQKSGCIINFSSISACRELWAGELLSGEGGDSGPDAHGGAGYGEVWGAGQRHLAGGQYAHDGHGA